MWNIEKLISKGDYIYALVPNHPNATKNGYVLYHRIVVENNIGRLLTKDEIIHHKDGNTKNNSIENLQIMTSVEHHNFHKNHTIRTYAKIKCPNCGKIFVKEKRNSIDKRQYNCCKSCGNKFKRLNTKDRSNRLSSAVIDVFRAYTDEINTILRRD